MVGMGWSDQEQLVIVLEDGNSLIYDIHGKLVRNFLLLEAATTVHILECHFWGNGVVAISSDMKLFVAEVIVILLVNNIRFAHMLIYYFLLTGTVQFRGRCWVQKVYSYIWSFSKQSLHIHGNHSPSNS